MLLKEFDQEKVAVINPDMIHQQVESFPETVISIFSHDLFYRIVEFFGGKEIAHTRDVEFFQFLYAGDNLDHSQWDPRSLSGQIRLEDKEKIALLAFELACKIEEQIP